MVEKTVYIAGVFYPGESCATSSVTRAIRLDGMRVDIEVDYIKGECSASLYGETGRKLERASAMMALASDEDEPGDVGEEKTTTLSVGCVEVRYSTKSTVLPLRDCSFEVYI